MALGLLGSLGCVTSVGDGAGGDGGHGGAPELCPATADQPLHGTWSQAFEGVDQPGCSGDGCFPSYSTTEALASTPDGGTLVSGTYVSGASFAGTSLPGAGKLLAKLDSSGALVWQKTVPGEASPSQLVVEPSGDFWWNTNVSDDADFGGGTVGMDGYLVHYDADGHYLGAFPGGRKARFFGGGTMALAPNGDLVVAGGIENSLAVGDTVLQAIVPASQNPFIARITPSGHVTSSQIFSGSVQAGIEYVGLASDGTLYAAGFITGELDIGSIHLSSPENRTEWVAAFDTSLQPIFAKTIGDGGSFSAPSVCQLGTAIVDASDHLLVSCLANDRLDLGGGVVVGVPDGLQSGVLIELARDGSVVSSDTAPGYGWITSFSRAGCLVRAMGIGGQVTYRGASLDAGPDQQKSFMLLFPPAGPVLAQTWLGGDVDAAAESRDGSFVVGGQAAAHTSVGNLALPLQNRGGFVARFDSLWAVP